AAMVVSALSLHDALPIWAQTWVIASDWVGLTLPGMIDEPGSFSGRESSPRPARGPEPRKRMSLAILKSAAAAELIAPCAKTMARSEEHTSELQSREKLVC